MAKIKFPVGTAEKTFELDTELISPPILKLRIRPTFKRDAMPIIAEWSEKAFSPMFREAARLAMEVVEAWDLEGEDGKPIPCNEEAKKKYLDPLLWEFTKTETTTETPGSNKPEERTPSWLWAEVLKFARDLGNFSKN